MENLRFKISARFYSDGTEVVSIGSNEHAYQEFSFPPGGAVKFINAFALFTEANWQAQGFENPNLKRPD